MSLEEIATYSAVTLMWLTKCEDIEDNNVADVFAKTDTIIYPNEIIWEISIPFLRTDQLGMWDWNSFTRENG